MLFLKHKVRSSCLSHSVHACCHNLIYFGMYSDFQNDLWCHKVMFCACIPTSAEPGGEHRDFCYLKLSWFSLSVQGLRTFGQAKVWSQRPWTILETDSAKRVNVFALVNNGPVTKRHVRYSGYTGKPPRFGRCTQRAHQDAGCQASTLSRLISSQELHVYSTMTYTHMSPAFLGGKQGCRGKSERVVVYFW